MLTNNPFIFYLTLFQHMLHFYIPRKHLNTGCVRTFSEGIEVENWLIMVEICWKVATCLVLLLPTLFAIVPTILIEIKWWIIKWKQENWNKMSTNKCSSLYLAGNYKFKVNNRSTRARCELCSKLTIKTTLERHYWRRSGVFIVNFEYIPFDVPVFLLLTLSR